MNVAEQIINKALKIVENNFEYTDYDEDAGLTLADAITIIIMDSENHDTEMESDKVYDFINELID